MNDRKGRKSIATCVLLVTIALLVSCQHPPAEQRVRAAIASAATAARANDPRGVLDVVSAEFVGNDGELDRRILGQLLVLRALRQDHAGVLVGPIAFEHEGDRIIARFDLVLADRVPGGLLPRRSAIYAMVTAWRREGGRWVCYNATWTGDS